MESYLKVTCKLPWTRSVNKSVTGDSSVLNFWSTSESLTDKVEGRMSTSVVRTQDTQRYDERLVLEYLLEVSKLKGVDLFSLKLQ